MKRYLLSITFILASFASMAETIVPDGTYMYAKRDTCDLYLDVYEPSQNSKTAFDGEEKPSIIFLFGGGFISGSRDDKEYLPWYKDLNNNGYRVIAIDYRLGLKGSKSVGIAQVNTLDMAIHLAVEDLFSATAYILENADCLKINPDNIVICGSSAGAITVLQADYELCNRTPYSEILPENFRYAGVMSFSGGILSRNGKLKYKEEPAPTLLFHGTSDKLVNYKQITFFKLGFFGSDKIASRFSKFGYKYNILRYVGHGHEISGIMGQTVPQQLEFIENNIIKKNGTIIDKSIENSGIPKGNGSQSRKELYGK